MKKHILLVHHDIEMCRKVQQVLEDDAIAVIHALSLNDAIRRFVNEEFCLVILDAGLSESNEHRFLKMMRLAKPIPILILSDKAEYPDRLQAFQSGASAYLGKPYELEECLAQAKSLIDLYVELKPGDSHRYILAYETELIIDPNKRQVYLKGCPIDLTRKEFDLLFCLVSHSGLVLSREQIYNKVWDSDIVYNVDETVKSHIKTLRKKLYDTDIDYIKNVWGVGYRFNAERGDK